jgi:hypothetical protein
MKTPNIRRTLARITTTIRSTSMQDLRQLSQRRWGIKKRPQPALVQPLVVFAPQLSSGQIAFLRQLERIKQMRVFAFVQTLGDQSVRIPFTVLHAPDTDIDAAVDVLRTLIHTKRLRYIPVMRLGSGVTSAARIVMHHLKAQAQAAVPAVCFPSLVDPVVPRAPSTKTQMLLCGESTFDHPANVRLVAPPQPAGASPLVSVVITTFNDAVFVEQALQSILQQSYQHLEVIVVDDASSDNSVATVRNIAAGDKRVKLIALPENQGLFSARNTGMAAASGAFLTFQDADDISRLDRIERCVAGIGGADYLYGLFVRTLADGTITDLGAPSIYQEGIITLFFKRSLLDGVVGYFDPLRVVSDSEYIERFRALRLHAVYLPEVLYFARLREGSLTTTRGPLAIYTTDGKITKSAAQVAYVKEYRRLHRQRGSLRWDQAPIDWSKKPSGCAPACRRSRRANAGASAMLPRQIAAIAA